MFDKLGMTPVVAPEETPPEPARRYIHIENGQATLEGVGGLDALAVLADTIYSEYLWAFKAPDHPPIAGYGKVCLELENGELTLRFGTGNTPELLSANPTIAKGMLLQAWLYLCERTHRGEFDPRAALLEGLQLVKPKAKRKAVTHGKRNHPKRK